MADRAAVAAWRGDYQYGFKDPERYVFESDRGLSRRVVEEISERKGEPEWMLRRRLQALEIFARQGLPRWGPDLSGLDFRSLRYFVKASEGPRQAWDEVPEDIKRTFDRLGVPEAERQFLGGLGAQYESEAVYHRLKEEWSRLGVVFVDTDTALREYPDVVREYWGTVVPAVDNKFAALNSAVWSGGSFVYVPEGVQVAVPLQAYFRINAENVGQFERTLIVVEPGAYVHYIEGCTAPTYSSHSLHAAVVEVVVKKGARVRYTTVQNWSRNVFNLVTKRAVAGEEAVVEWVDGNLGSSTTMKYPSVYMKGPGARAEILSIAFAGAHQHLDAGARVLHLAPHTSSTVTSKSVSVGGGRSSYRGLVHVAKGAVGAKSSVRCDALLLDEESRSDTYPRIRVEERDALVAHEATVSKIGEEQLFYLMSRGLTRNEATSLIVTGFVEPVVKQLPMEYAVELNRLIELQMEDSLG